MPQISGGPKGLNEILHSTYFSALKQSKDKGRASAIAWAAAKDEYRKKGGKWVSKMYEDLGTIILAIDKVVTKADAPDYEYLLYPIQQLAKDAKGIEEETPVEQLAIEEVLVNPYNREVDRDKVDKIKQAIQESSSVKPAVYSEVDNDGKKGKMIIDGHHRYLALKELGYVSIPARLANSKGTKTSDNDEPVALTKVDVAGLELVREDLQGAPKKGTSKLPEGELVTKGGPGSGPHPGDPISHVDNVNEQLRRVKEDFKTGKINMAEFKQRAEPLYAKVQRTGHFSGQTVKPVPAIVEKGGPGSGRHPEEIRTANESQASEYIRYTVPPKHRTLVGNYIATDKFHDDVERHKENIFNEKHQYGQQKGPHAVVRAINEHLESKGIKKADFEKGGPGSGCTGPDCGRPSIGTKKEPKTGLSFLHGLRPAIKVGSKIHSGNLHETHADIYNRLMNDFPGPEMEERDDIDTGFATSEGVWMSRSELMQRFGERTAEGLAEQQQAALKFIKADLQRRREDHLQKGGPGSGRHYEGGPKDIINPSAGNKAFAEPFHSPKHIKQFLSSNDVVLASVNRADLSPEKNALRQQEFEGYLQNSKIPYKKGIGVSRSWGNEESYMIHAPEKEQAAKLHDLLSRKYAQDAVIHVRNGHCTMQFKDGKVKHANINDLQGGNITDDYTEMDGQRFKIPFKD